MPIDLIRSSSIGIVITTLSHFGAILLPIPIWRPEIYEWFFAPIGALFGYGFALYEINRKKNKYSLPVFSFIASVISGFFYSMLFDMYSSPGFFLILLQIVLFIVSFFGFGFALGWAGISLIKKNDHTMS